MHIVQQLNDWALWAHPNPGRCPCRGGGWLVSDYDTVHGCGLHGGAPHPEDEEGHETFDFEAHRLGNLRKAFITFRENTGMEGPAFKAAVLAQVGADATPQAFVDAANVLSDDHTYEAQEAEARSRGYSCGLEMRWDDEAAHDADMRGFSDY